jgi:hypothetical protein
MSEKGNEPVQIKGVEELEGKTIERVIGLERYDSDHGLVFADGSFVVLKLRCEYEDEEPELMIDDAPANDYTLLLFGLIDHKEYRARADAKEAERIARKAAEQEAKDRAEYERLRAKFGAAEASSAGA